MNNAIKKILLAILGFLQGTLGSYLALLGWAFAFPETSPGAWLVIMITAIILLRKNKANFLSFIIPWFMGLVGCLTIVFVMI